MGSRQFIDLDKDRDGLLKEQELYRFSVCYRMA